MNAEQKKASAEAKKHNVSARNEPIEEMQESQNKSSEDDSNSGDGRLWNLSPKQTVFHGSRADVHTSRDSICSFTTGSKYAPGKARNSHTGPVRGNTLLDEDVREQDERQIPPVPKRMKIIDSIVTYFVFFCSVSVCRVGIKHGMIGGVGSHLNLKCTTCPPKSFRVILTEFIVLKNQRKYGIPLGNPFLSVRHELPQCEARLVQSP